MKSKRNQNRRIVTPRRVLVLIVVGLLFVRYVWFLRKPDPPILKEGPCEVVRVVDGDTLIVKQKTNLKQQEFRVRLLGIDTPETVKPNHPVEAFGAEATDFTRDFVKRGEFYLQLGKRRQDRFGRWLAFLFIKDESHGEDKLLNEELVRAGLARVSIFPGDSATMTRKLINAEKEAQENKRGIWSEDALNAPGN